MDCSKSFSILAAILGFVSFHFLYTDGWSFDGTWSKLRELKERICPSPENRPVGWWHAPLGYACAMISMILWVLSTLYSK